MSTDALDADSEPLCFEVTGWPTFPAGVVPHDLVDLDAEDPSHVEGRSTRQCVSTRQDGERCRGVAMRGQLICALHAGRVDSAEGGRAKARKARERRQKAEEDVGRRSLGTRAMIADVLHERAEDVATVVNDLINRAAKGDMKAQSLLLPYINQALGMPTERVEHAPPGEAEQLRSASTAELEALVAEGRKRRFSAVPD